MSRRPITAPGAVSVGPYSHAIISGDVVFLSGQTPLDPSAGTVVTGARLNEPSATSNVKPWLFD